MVHAQIHKIREDLYIYIILRTQLYKREEEEYIENVTIVLVYYHYFQDFIP